MEKIEDPNVNMIERLPHSLTLEILLKLDLESLCCAAPICRTLDSLVSQALSSITTLDLSGFTPDSRILRRILGENTVIKSLTIDCRQLDDSSVRTFSKVQLEELVLLKCRHFSPWIFTVLNEVCSNLRVFKMEGVYGHSFVSSRGWKRNITEFLKDRTHLEIFWMKFPDVDFYTQQVGIVRSVPESMKDLLLQPVSEREAKSFILEVGSSRASSTSAMNPDFPFHIGPVDFQLRSLSLVLSNMTDDLVSIIVTNLPLLTELCLEDRPLDEPAAYHDLTNIGLELLGSLNHLTSLSLTRSQEYRGTTFTRVNDMGMFLLAERCRSLQSIRFSGFSRVTDAGYVSVLHSCKNMRKLEIVNASFLSDLAFHGILNTHRSLVDLKLISCGLLTSETAASLASCESLQVLDLSSCKSIGDEGLVSISKLCNLTSLDLSGADITDKGLSALGKSKSPIARLRIRGCKRVNDRGISSLFLGDGIIRETLSSIDLGFMPGITDRAVFTIAEVCKELREVCLRSCFYITDAALEALSTMSEHDGRRPSLRKLDLYRCGGLSPKSYQLIKGPSLQNLRWLGVGRTSFMNRCMVEFQELIDARPWASICLNGCEMGCKDGWQFHDHNIHDAMVVG